jgi:hypothetical protein
LRSPKAFPVLRSRRTVDSMTVSYHNVQGQRVMD